MEVSSNVNLTTQFDCTHCGHDCPINYRCAEVVDDILKLIVGMNGVLQKVFCDHSTRPQIY